MTRGARDRRRIVRRQARRRAWSVLYAALAPGRRTRERAQAEQWWSMSNAVAWQLPVEQHASIVS